MDSRSELVKSLGQGHIFTFFDELNDEEKSKLAADIEDVDWESLASHYKSEVEPKFDGTNLKPTAKIQSDLLRDLPDECIEGTSRCDKETLSRYQATGLSNIKDGNVAALLLAGGQGTRLGVAYPKGMYDVGLPSGKTLFQLQGERILELSRRSGGKIIWYIMTSEATMEETIKFFKQNNYFGLKESEVVFFEQGTIPCFGFDGKVFLEQKHKLARSPDGNGGLYESLHNKGIIDHMRMNGVRYLHVYCVDNILVRICDPTFMGFCIERSIDAGAKVVEKVSPNESVGIICKVGERFRVIEYSEISDEIACKRNPLTGRLTFNAGNICDHFFKVDFLNTIKGDRKLRYHIAIKKIRHLSLVTGEQVQPGEPNGIKLEKFIFDVFEYTDQFAAWEVKREDEFSPLKNADGTSKDNPTTARAALLRAYELGLLKV